MMRFFTLTALCASAFTQVAFARDHIRRTFNLVSDHIMNNTDQGAIVYEGKISFSKLFWLRIEFDKKETSFKPGYGLRLIATQDNSTQVFPDQESFEQWNGMSAYFNGEEVTAQWFVHDASKLRPISSPEQDDQDALPKLKVVALITSDTKKNGNAPETLCGTEDRRVRSELKRVARLLPIFCTGWIIGDEKKCMLTAGHCQGYKDRAVVQFNVPLSLPDGTVQHPPASDQYPLDPESIQTIDNYEAGNDWMYFGAFPNPETKKTAYEVQQDAYTLFNGTDLSEVKIKNIQIAGHGSSGIKHLNLVQTTHDGPFAGFEDSLRSGRKIITYRTDTTGGDSGSAVLDVESGLAIGIHTNGGCYSSGGANFGTLITNPKLQEALKNPTGVCK